VEKRVKPLGHLSPELAVPVVRNRQKIAKKTNIIFMVNQVLFGCQDIKKKCGFPGEILPVNPLLSY
jgi:hypothetical protein